MSTEQFNSNSETNKQTARLLDFLQPDEYEKYLKVSGWIIRQTTIFDGLDEDHYKAVKEAETNPLGLRIEVDGKGYQQIWDKYQEITGVTVPTLFRGVATFDRPSFILVPLGEEKVSELAKKNRLHEILKQSELKEILLH